VAWLAWQRNIEIDVQACGQCATTPCEFGIDRAQHVGMLIDIARKRIEHGLFR
jgi:hypothetical protein